MKQKLIILALLIPVIAGGIIILNSSLHSNNNPDQQTNQAAQKCDGKHEHACCAHHKDMEEHEASENSVYLLESNWKTESGSTVKLDIFKGKPVVMAMIFTSCAYACPAIVMDMKKIEDKLTPEQKKETRFLLVSIDPDRDTPDAMMKFAKTYKLDLNRWKLLTGKKEDISDLAGVLGFKYRRENDGNFSHSNLITVLKENGEIAYQHSGINEDVADVVSAVKEY